MKNYNKQLKSKFLGGIPTFGEIDKNILANVMVYISEVGLTENQKKDDSIQHFIFEPHINKLHSDINLKNLNLKKNR